MGTIMNNNIWSGVCVKNEEVTGLVKNGNIFYEKIIGEIYKRRVMVGDNLRNLTVYQTYPKNYYLKITENTILIEFDKYNNISQSGSEEYGYFVEAYSDSQGQVGFLYSYQDNVERINDVYFDDSGNNIVVSITDCEGYRHLYIEDKNIRTVKIGDVITKDTVLYFNFPDDIYTKINANTSNVIELDNMTTGTYLTPFYMGETDISIIAMIEYGGGSSNTLYEVLGGTIKKNISKGVNITDGTSVFSGTVTKIYKDNPLYNYILVDKTTLG